MLVGCHIFVRNSANDGRRSEFRSLNMLVVILVGILSVILGGGDTPKICHEILSCPQLLCLEDCDDHLQYATDFEFSRLNR